MTSRIFSTETKWDYKLVLLDFKKQPYDFFSFLTAQLTVFLLDVNDNPPEFIPSSVYSARISEASQPGIEVKQVLAIDQDKDSDVVSYYMEDGSQYFEITEANRLSGMWT